MTAERLSSNPRRLSLAPMRISLVIAHDELIFYVPQKSPDLVHGVDFQVGQNMCHDTGKRPEAARPHVLDQCAREERDHRLMAADALFSKAMDSGDTPKTQQVGQYRQAPREVPKQPRFPANFAWLDIPDALSDPAPSNDQNTKTQATSI